MKPISHEKRELLVAAKMRGETIENIAKWLQISTATVINIWRLQVEKQYYLSLIRVGLRV